MRNALIIFIKNPALGKVKTRLAKTIGDYNALKIYQHLLTHVLEITYDLDHLEKFLYYNDFIPTNDEWPAKLYQKELQKGNHLGEKMDDAFTKAFNEDFKKAVMIMPDCPKMTDTLIEKAFKVLDNHDFVIGPTNDGGFYLLGMKAYNDSPFKDKVHGNATSFEHTLENIKASGKKYFIMPALLDVDMEEDLGNLKKILEVKGGTLKSPEEIIEEVPAPEEIKPTPEDLL